MPKPTSNPPAPASAREPLELLWRPQALVWILFAGEGLALLLALAPGILADRWTYFGLLSLGVQWISLLTLGALYLCRRPLGRAGLRRTALVALLLLLLSTWLVGHVAWSLFHDAWGAEPDSPLWFVARACGMTLVIGTFAFIAFDNHWRTRQLALRAKQAELEALQARIRPHFLFNTLNTGAALVHQRPEAVEQLLLDLADLFRAALAGPHQISLEDELALARRYLEIESLRFRERLRIDWKLPREVPDVTVPALTIQPLVENAIRHGIEQIPAGGDIEIAVTTSTDRVIVRITNPLPGKARSASGGHRVGLNAAQERVEALTEGRGSVTTQREGDRYVATVRLPVEPA